MVVSKEVSFSWALFQVLLIDELQPFSFVYAMLIEEGNEEAAECETCDRCP